MVRTLITPSTQVGLSTSPGKPRALPGETFVPERATPRAPAARPRRKGLRHPLSLPVLLFAMTLGLILLHQGRLVEYFFPLGAFGVALVLYWRSPAHYIGFVCWLFFLTPEVRRLADFVNGSFNQQSPIMVATLLAVSLTGLTLIRRAALLGQPSRAIPTSICSIWMRATCRRCRRGIAGS